MKIFEFKMYAFGRGLPLLAHKQLRSSWVLSSVKSTAAASCRARQFAARTVYPWRPPLATLSAMVLFPDNMNAIQ
jgi:hypothetical protein